MKYLISVLVFNLFIAGAVLSLTGCGQTSGTNHFPGVYSFQDCAQFINDDTTVDLYIDCNNDVATRNLEATNV